MAGRAMVVVLPPAAGWRVSVQELAGKVQVTQAVAFGVTTGLGYG